MTSLNEAEIDRALQQIAALDLAPSGIRINTVAPTYVHPSLTKKILAADAELPEALAESIPLRGIGSVDDVESRRTVVPMLTGGDEAGREIAVLRRLVAAYQYLSSLAAQDADIGTVTKLIAERVGAAVAVVDERLSILAACGGPVYDRERFCGDLLSHPRLVRVFRVVGRTRRPLRIPDIAGTGPVIVAPIPVGDAVPAYLLTLDIGERDDGEDLRLLITEHAATICGVVLGRERVVAAAATQARYDLVEGLLSGKGSDADEVRRWAAYLGYDEQRQHRVLSFVAGGHDSDDQTRRVLAAVERFFTTQVPEAITALHGHEVVVVLPEPDPASPRSSRIASACIARTGTMFRDVAVTAGIGGVCRSAVEIAHSYDDAVRTVEIVRRTGRAGTAVAVEDLGIHRLLLQLADAAQLREFVREVFAGLLEHANGNAMEYLATLACYFRENNSPQRASQALHVHPNTVSYRVRRIEELTKLDFRNYRDRLMAQVAVEILDGVGEAL